MTMNVFFTGRLGKDPNMQYTPDGNPVTDLRLATNNIRGETMWANVSVWGKQAESCNQYLHTGDTVTIVGRLEFDPETGGPRIFETKDGYAGASFDITATSVEFVSTKREGTGQQQGSATKAKPRPRKPAPRPPQSGSQGTPNSRIPF